MFLVSSSWKMAAVGHAATSSRYSVTLLALCIASFTVTEIYSPRNALETWKYRETTNVTSYQTKFGLQAESTQRQRPRCRGKRFLLCRVRHSTDERSWFNIQRLQRCGDIHLNPGPIKFPCKECEKSVRNNQNAMLCSECGLWIHAKCLNMSTSTFKYFLERPAIEWTCPLCSLPRLGDSFFLEDEEIITTEGNYTNQLLLQPNANKMNNTLFHSQENVAINNCGQQEFDLLLQERQEHSNRILMFHLNINSLQNKLEELKLLNDKMKSQIIFLSETKIDKSYPNSQFTLTGYNMYRKDRKKGGGGIIAYFDSSLPSKELKVTKKYKTLEILAVEARLGNNEVIFLGIYRPPKQSDHQPDPNYLERVEEELNNVCMWVSLKKQIFIITGDLNLDRLKPESREGKILADLEEVHGMQCLITKPTRITSTSETLLDVILTNKPNLFRTGGSFNPEISDHHLIYGILKQSALQHRRKTITFRSLKNVDMDQLNEDLASAPWTVGETFDAIEDQYGTWKTIFESVLDKHMPKKKMRVRQKDVPYMTEEWKMAIRNKRKYAQLFAQNRTLENWELKKKWRNLATKERRRAIKAYWAQKSDELGKRPRDFYKTFKSFLSDKSKEETTIAVRINERIVTNQKVVADELGDYFSTVANTIGDAQVTNLVEKDFEKHPSVESIRQAYQGLQFGFNEIGSSEVENELKMLKSNKATGWDGISPKILKLTAKGLAPSLTSLYNTVIRKGNWPNTWKMGEWTPVFKKGDKTDRGNYRPITVLNSVDKVFESLLSKQITKTMDPHLYQKMSPYRKTHSCETTLIRLTEDWKMAADNK